MKHIVSFLIVVGFPLITTMPLTAAPIRDYPTVLTQPDGTSVKVLLSGDEYFNWAHDKNGYVIMQDRISGFWVYAARDGDDIAPTAYVAGKVNPASVGLTPNALPSPDGMASIRKEKLARRYSDDGPSYAPTQGTLNNIVIYIRFQDQTEFNTPTATYDAMFNGATSTESMRNYYKEVSYTKLTVNTYFYPTTTGSTVVSFQDSHPRAYYEPYNATTNPVGYQDDSQAATREHTLLAAAVNAVSSQVPTTLNLDLDSDGRVDNVCFVVKGSPGAWADLLWPHQWSLYTQYVTLNGKRVYTYNLQLENNMLHSGGVGVLCHEMFHSLGAPDLYHYSYDGFVPVGSWDLMENDQDPPQHMSAYMKYRYGHWIDSIPEITNSGTYTLNPLTYSTNNCFKIKSPNSTTEYFVLEYRLRTGKFENSLPGSGLLVYRVNACYDGEGNASGPPDELIVFRPKGTCTANGSVSSANLCAELGRTSINDDIGFKSFLSNCSPAGLDIANVGSAGTTISFDVHIKSGTARGLAVSNRADSFVGEPLNPQIVVVIRDTWGNVATTSTAPVTLAIKANTGTPGATLLGTTTANAVNGVAVFTNVAIDKPGEGYVLTAMSPGLDSADSNTFRVTFPIVRVSTTGNDAYDGFTWAKAKRTVQAGIEVASSVWVARGVYRQDITLKEGVALYGGFAGNETSLGQRNPAANVTTLNATSSSSVAVTANVPQASIDGFTVRNGSTGIYVSTSATVTVTNCIISGHIGDGVSVGSGTAVVTGCSISRNNTGVRVDYGRATISNCTITGNVWGIKSLYVGMNGVYNCIVSFNETGIQGAYPGGGIMLSHNDVHGNITANYSNITDPTGKNGNISADPMFVDGANGDYHLEPGSLCIDAGDDSFVSPQSFDLDGNPRLNGLHVDIGCYESITSPPVTNRVSVTTAGAQADAGCLNASISLHGDYVVFASDASIFDVPFDFFKKRDILIRNRQEGSTKLVSIGVWQSDGDSDYPSVSADGRYVVFSSLATNLLITGDTNNVSDIYLRDTYLGTTTRISVGVNGAQSDGSSQYPVISANGLYVAFRSEATNLVSGDTNGCADVFVYSQQTGTTERVSVSTAGAQSVDQSGNTYRRGISISSDGRYVAFDSYAPNLVSGDTNGKWDVFLRDRQAGTTTRVSLSTSGVEGNGHSQVPSVSDDGRYVAFESYASNLVGGDTNVRPDIFVRDMSLGTTVRVSLASDGTERVGNHLDPSISGDGRFISFHSQPAMVPEDTNAVYDVYVVDRVGVTIKRVSVSTDGVQGNSDSTYPSLSGDGRYVAFASTASNLVSNDTNGVQDIFWRGPLSASIPSPNRLAFIVQPGNATEGFPFGTQPVVVAYQPDGTTSVNFTGAVTISIKAGTGTTGAVLVGTKTVNCVAGVATFADLLIDKAGTRYVLTATSPGLISPDSVWFEVEEVAKTLAYSIPPNNAKEGSPFGTQPVVVARRSDGTTVTNFTGAVTVSIESGSGTESAVLSGTKTVNCIAGVARFTDLSIDKAGTGYRLAATSPGLSSAISYPFNIRSPIIRVSTIGDDANDGLSWAKAKRTVQAGISMASGEVWVACGVYQEDIRLEEGVALYGGFAGTETERRQRNIAANASVLNGTSDYLPVVTAFVSQTSINGFTIQNGDRGVYVGDGQATVSNCTLCGSEWGVYVYAGEATVSNCAIRGSYTAVYTYIGTATVSNSSITGNENGVLAFDGAATVYNSIMAFNGTGIGRYNPYLSMQLSHNNVFGNSTANYANITNPTDTNGNISVDPMFVDGANGDYHLVPGSLCIDAGDDSAVSTGDLDLDGYPRIQGAHVDMGCFESATLLPATTRVSISTAGAQANSRSLNASISQTGAYVVFSSDAANLVSGDTNGKRDVFLWNRTPGVTSRICVASDGTQGNGDSDYPSVSADGRYVVFTSSATNLVTGDTNGVSDIFLRDTTAGTTARITVGVSGAQSNGASQYPVISANGFYVAFRSEASNLVSGDTNGCADVFVYSRQTGTTECVSVSTAGAQGADQSGNTYRRGISISSDGRYVAFDSYAPNLVSGDTNGKWDVFLRDRQAGTTTRVSLSTSGVEGNGYSQVPSVSDDGRYVAFESYASNLVSGDTNGNPDIFVRDMSLGATVRVSLASDGTERAGNHLDPSISGDGRYVAFDARPALVPEDTNVVYDVYVVDRVGATIKRVSVSADGTQGNSDSTYPSVSGDGRYVAFASTASNLVSGDTNGVQDIFVRGPLDTAKQAFNLSEVAKCLRIAGGLTIANTGEATRYNIDGSASGITLIDAVRISRKAAGLEANP